MHDALFPLAAEAFKGLACCSLFLGALGKGANTDEAVEIVESARLLSKSMFKALFDDALVKQEKFLFLTKSFMAVRVDGEEVSS